MDVRFISLLVVIGLLVSCNPQPTLLPTVMPEATRTATNTLTPSITSSTPFPTWTPLPILSDSQAEAMLLEWLQGSPDCQLPCWAGITPGVTTWQEAKQTLGAVLNFEAVHENARCDFGLCNLIEWQSRTDIDVFGYIASESNDIIYGITIHGYPPSPLMRLDRILDQYGLPDKAFLSVAAHDHPFFDLVLAYPNHQFIINYAWKAIISHDNVVSCIQEGSVFLIIEPVYEEWTDSFIENKVFGSEHMDFFLPLDEATDMTINEFYDEFKSIDGTECITTPRQAWIPSD